MKPAPLYPKDMSSYSYHNEYYTPNDEFYPSSYPEQYVPSAVYDDGSHRNMTCINPQDLFGTIQMSSPPLESYDYHSSTYPFDARHSTLDRDRMDYVSHGTCTSAQRRRTAPVNMIPSRDQSASHRLEVPSISSSRRSSRPSPTVASLSTSPLTPPLSPTTSDLYPQPPTMLNHNTNPIRRPSSHSHSQPHSQSLPLHNISTTTTSSTRFYCTHPDCTTASSDPSSTKRPRSFSRRADLQRHHDTTHEPHAPSFSCPRNNCTRKGDNGFSRMDHLIEHRRGYHGENIPKRGARGRRDSGASSGSKDGKKRIKSSQRRESGADDMVL